MFKIKWKLGDIDVEETKKTKKDALAFSKKLGNTTNTVSKGNKEIHSVEAKVINTMF
ncbi:MAG: hypothetical protein HKN40_13130 [Winogradskyella sp.]|uniref:hypothetical protein n=1 Tax=Winogradskyella sp. TaxID=1883156 RepID=UPI00178F2E60|nr:hypothetical protein [Winogradskyella sp.]